MGARCVASYRDVGPRANGFHKKQRRLYSMSAYASLILEMVGRCQTRPISSRFRRHSAPQDRLGLGLMVK